MEYPLRHFLPSPCPLRQLSIAHRADTMEYPLRHFLPSPVLCVNCPSHTEPTRWSILSVIPSLLPVLCVNCPSHTEPTATRAFVATSGQRESNSRRAINVHCTPSRHDGVSPPSLPLLCVKYPSNTEPTATGTFVATSGQRESNSRRAIRVPHTPNRHDRAPPPLLCVLCVSMVHILLQSDLRI